MGFKKNEVRESKKRYGVHTLIPVAINPTAKELAKLYNSEPRDEKVYVTEKEDEDGNKYTQLQVAIYFKTVEDPKYLDSFSIFFESRLKEFKNGQKQFLNKQGYWKMAFNEEDVFEALDKKATLKDVDRKSFRPAYVGEVELVELLKAINNISFLQEAYLDNPEKLFSGDVTELREAMIWTDSAKKHAGFKALIGVDDKGYCKVYSTYLPRTAVSNKNISDALARFDFKANYPIDLRPQEYDPFNFKSTKKVSTGIDDSDVSTMPDDDLPF